MLFRSHETVTSDETTPSLRVNDPESNFLAARYDEAAGGEEEGPLDRREAVDLVRGARERCGGDAG